MNKKYIMFGSLTTFVVALLLLASRAYADEGSPSFLKDISDDRANVQSQLGIDPQADPYPQPTGYYDDLEDHYEQGFLMGDVIAQGLN